MKKLLLFTLILFTVSCDVTRAPAVQQTRNSVTQNQIQKKQVGESILTLESGYFAKAIIITQSNTVKNSSVSVNPGAVFVHLKSNNKYDFYYPEGTEIVNNYIQASYGIAIEKKSGTAKYRGADGIGFSQFDFSEPLQYTAAERPDKNRNYFKKEFIYNGKSGSTLKFSYREFSNDYARPAFTQDLQYDLDESSIIGFREMRIEVKEASNTNITYMVQNGFNS